MWRGGERMRVPWPRGLSHCSPRGNVGRLLGVREIPSVRDALSSSLLLVVLTGLRVLTMTMRMTMITVIANIY